MPLLYEISDLWVRSQLVECLGELLLLVLKHDLHGTLLLLFSLNASHIGVKVSGEFIFAAKHEHTSKGTVHAS